MVLEKTEPVGAVDRTTRISDSLMPSANELQSEIGMLPVTPTAKACSSEVRRNRRGRHDRARKPAGVTEAEESEDHQTPQFSVDDSDADDEAEAPIVDLQLDADDRQEGDVKEADSDPFLNVRS